MHTQAKTLRDLLASVGIKRMGKTPSVKTTRRYYASGKYEWDYAESHTDALTQEQISELKTLNQYVRIFNCPECNFAIIKS